MSMFRDGLQLNQATDVSYCCPAEHPINSFCLIIGKYQVRHVTHTKKHTLTSRKTLEMRRALS